jgi:phosphate-selective porin OprO/OprP
MIPMMPIRMRYLVFLLLALAPVELSGQTSGTVKPAGKEPSLTLGGLLQIQTELGDRGDARFANDNDRLYLRRARLNATGKFLEEFDFRLELDLAGTLANTTGLRAQMTDGYITWNRYSKANVRVGQFKTPFGFEQLYGDPRLPILERSLANDRLTFSRQLGVQVQGDLAEKRASYSVGAFNGNGQNNNFNDDDRFLLVGRFSGTPWERTIAGKKSSWAVGGNAFRSTDTGFAASAEFGFDSTPATPDRDNLFSGERHGYGVDSQLLLGPFELWAEYLNATWEPISRRPLASVESEGGYVQAGYYVVPDRFQVVLKAETYDPRKENDEDSVSTGTLGLNYFFKGHDLKFGVDYLRVQGDRLATPRDQDEDKVIARLQVIF